jgi:nucleosome assembly protein 1-like 1
MDTTTQAAIKGIPCFWLTAMKNCESLTEAISRRDENILRHLKDIRIENPEVEEEEADPKNPEEPSRRTMAYKIIFDFGPNEYMENTQLTKTYWMHETDDVDTFEFDRSEGCDIKWLPNKNPGLAMRRSSRNDPLTRLVEVSSFFDFFCPPQPRDHADSDSSSDSGINSDGHTSCGSSCDGNSHYGSHSESGSDSEDQLQEAIGIDFEFGEIFRSQLCPRAIDWFTGRNNCYHRDERPHHSHHHKEPNSDSGVSSDDGL